MKVINLLRKLEKQYGEAPGITYFNKNNELLGDETDCIETHRLDNLYEMKVLEQKPGYHEWLVKLDTNTKGIKCA